ncbi:MAG TPA: substrate-binding domain-containing protein [Longilinea sp.]|nr:substrate-binding domain-containing protein [Longilinea sp.]
MRKAAFTVLILLLVACQPPPASETKTLGQPLVISVTDSLEWLGPDLAGCAAEVGVAVQYVVDKSAGDDGIRLRLGEPETDGYTALLGEDHLAVIVHPDNPEQEISLDTLQAVFSGKQEKWADQSEIQFWSLPRSSDVTIALLAAGIKIANAGLAPTSKTMLNVIAENPNAIGFIPAHWVDDSVRVLQVTGLDISFPILATSRMEPQGAARAWLVCLQEKMGK